MENPIVENPIGALNEQDDDLNHIDFSQVKSPKNQARIEIALLKVSGSGSLLFQSDNCELENPKYQDIIEYQKYQEKMKVLMDQYDKNQKRRSDILRQFWPRKFEPFYQPLLPAFEVDVDENLKEKLKQFADFELSDDETIDEKKILNRAFEMAARYTVPVKPKEYSPPNDPNNDYGWKAVCNKQKELEYQRDKEIEKYHVVEIKKSREISVKITNDENKTSSPEDSGVEMNSSSSSEDSETKISAKMFTDIGNIHRNYETLIKREMIKFLFSEEIMSEELRKSLKDDMTLNYYLNRPTPGLELEVTD